MEKINNHLAKYQKFPKIQLIVLSIFVILNLNCWTSLQIYSVIFERSGVIVIIGEKSQNKNIIPPVKDTEVHKKVNRLTFVFAGIRGYSNGGLPYVPGYFYVLDFPFSLIADIILIPVTLPAAVYNYYRNPKLLRTGKLFREIKTNNLEEVKRLVELGVDLNYDFYGTTPLHTSITKKKNIIISKYLIEKGGDVNSIVGDKRILNIAINGNDWNRDLSSKEANLFSFEIAKILIENGADIDGTSFWNKQTPLHLAVLNFNFELIKYLIQKGANLNKRDDEGNTPIFYAIDDWQQGSEIVKYLDQKGAKLNIENKKFRTPIQYMDEKFDFKDDVELQKILKEYKDKN